MIRKAKLIAACGCGDGGEFKTDKKAFAAYAEECKKWLERFGLVGWNIDIVHEETDFGTLAECEFNTQARAAALRLNKIWPIDVIDAEVRRSAFHEVCELLLCPIYATISADWRDRDTVEREIHVVIRTMENTVWAKEYRKK